MVVRSITMTFLGPMACCASISVWMPALTRKGAALYFSVCCDLSSTARICCVAAVTSRTTAGRGVHSKAGCEERGGPGGPRGPREQAPEEDLCDAGMRGPK